MTVTQPARRAHPWTGVVMWLAVLWVSVALMAGVALAQSDRVVAIGDIHGAAGPLRALLMTTGLTDETGHWSGGSATLGIVKLTTIGVIDPQDIVVDLLRGPTCWVSESA